MWYLESKSLTPFDERYLKVPYEFMEYSFLRYMKNHSYETIRDFNVKNIVEEKKAEELEEINKPGVKQLEDSYDAETVKAIMTAIQRQA